MGKGYHRQKINKSIPLGILDKFWGKLACTEILKNAFNSLAPGRFKRNFTKVTFKLILAIDTWVIRHDIALWWMSLDLTDDKSTLVQVMAWCHQAPSHCLSQCWPRSLLPYGVTRSQWVKNPYQHFFTTSKDLYQHFSTDPNKFSLAPGHLAWDLSPFSIPYLESSNLASHWASSSNPCRQRHVTMYITCTSV